MKKFLLGVLVILCFRGCVNESEEPVWSLKAGDTLPEFTVMTIDGNTVSSNDSYSHNLVIVFFNTTCMDCQEELPRIQRDYEENLNQNEEERSQYICIAREEGAEEISRYWSENGLTIPVSAQNDRRIYSLFASSWIPRIYHARNGVITYTYPSDH